MKKLTLVLFIVACAFTASAQKFALVDMEYILKNIPQYEMANEQLNQLSQRWQKEVEAKFKEAETLYKNYQADMVFLTDDQKKKKEEEELAIKKKKEEEKFEYSNELIGLLLILLSIIGIGNYGPAGNFGKSLCVFFTGILYILLLLFILYIGGYLIIKREMPNLLTSRLIGFYIIITKPNLLF